MSSTPKLNVTVWSEFRHEKQHPKVAAIYPDGMHRTIADALVRLGKGSLSVRTATLDEPDHGLTDAVLDSTDVLTWWGHMAHGAVSDEIVAKVRRRVLEGMGLVVLHSGHYSKIFKALMGDTCSLTWREATDKERLWVTCPSHPIVQGLPPYIELEAEEMYGEPFGIPTPDELIFISWFTGGEVFRSGATWRRGNGKIFYFRPGHETYPTYHNPQIQQVIYNGVIWAHSGVRIADSAPNRKPLEPLPPDPEATERPTVGHK
jgi:trehalose utilization protein